MELKTVSTKRASALLKNHPQRELWNDAAIGVMLEHEQKIAYANDAYACALGYPSGLSLIGMPIKAVIASHDRPRLLGYSRSRLTGNYAPPLYAGQRAGMERFALSMPAFPDSKRSRSHSSGPKFSVPPASPSRASKKHTIGTRRPSLPSR